jgi:predicted Zn-dependent peptidase
MKKLEFEEVELSNGIKIFHLRDKSVEWSDIRILFPVGHAHNTGNIFPGSFHFLEHMVSNRSALYPELQQFRQWVGLQGGSKRAATGDLNTQYGVRITSSLFEKAWKGLYSSIFTPLLREEDVERERSIIANERDLQDFYWPAASELGYIFMTKWMRETFVSNQRVMGSNKDLDDITSEYLKKIHRYYLTKDMKIILSLVIRDLENISLVSSNEALVTDIPKIEWKDQHATIAEDRKSNFYAIGNFAPGILSFKELTGVRLLGQFFADSYHGPLYQWLRNENPWVYSVLFTGYQWTNFFWFLKLSFSKKEHLDLTKSSIHDKLRASVLNKKSIATEINMVINDVSRDSGIKGRINDAIVALPRYGYVPTEKEWREAVMQCHDQPYLLGLYEKHFSAKVTGDCTILMKTTQ